MIVPIEKLMLWHGGSWKKYSLNECNLTLRVHCDQLLITTETKVLESLNMKEKIKGIYKDDVLVLLISRTGQELRKIKFQIKSNMILCHKELHKYFPIVSHNSRQSKDVVTPKYQNVKEVITYACRKDISCLTNDLPASFKNFVKLCLLDPSFPKIVQQTQNILNNETNKED